MKTLYKLLVTLFFSTIVFATNAANFPSCPAYTAAQPLFLSVPAVAQSSGPAGYQLSQYVVGTSNGITSSYNYFSQSSKSAAEALQQIHNLSALLHSAPLENTYQVGDVAYKQCVYWGSMIGTGIPTGNQVLSIQYSQTMAPPPPPAPTPLVLQTVQELPTSTVVGRLYTAMYTVSNNNTSAVAYTLRQNDKAEHVIFNEKIDNACNVSDQQSSLAANSSCNIEIQFNDPKIETYKSTEVMTLDSDKGVQPNSIFFQTSVRKIFAENVIIFGDSLSDRCTLHAPYVNNDPTVGKRNWAMDFVAQTAIYSRGLQCSKTPGLDVLLQNVDYAVGGARIKDIPSQISNYQNDLAEHKGPGGQSVHPGLNTKFIFWIGGNDLLAYDSTTSSDKMLQDMNTYADQLTDMIHAFAIKNNIPANNIYIIDQPNVGSARINANLPIPEILKELANYTRMSTDFNDRLKNNMSQFVAPNNLNPTIIDSYTPGWNLFMYVFTGSQDPHSAFAKYGFQQALMLTPCNSTEHGLTQACKGYMSWDGTHPDMELYNFFADTFSDVVDPKKHTFDK